MIEPDRKYLPQNLSGGGSVYASQVAFNVLTMKNGELGRRYASWQWSLDANRTPLRSI
jgi:hypothetical protein